MIFGVLILNRAVQLSETRLDLKAAMGLGSVLKYRNGQHVHEFKAQEEVDILKGQVERRKGELAGTCYVSIMWCLIIIFEVL